MLVLTVKDGERVILQTESGELITVLLSSSKDGRAKLGFEAPGSVSILREKLIREPVE
jgi:sRNA-binding carbon storage regulator CsrA